jgi:uncharacterized membrane protein
MSAWKRDFASGLVILVPVLVTLYVVLWLFARVAQVPLLERIVTPALFGGGRQAVVLAEILQVLLTLALFVLLVLSVGYLMRTALGGIVEALIDGLANRVPGLRIVYNASKMAVETALSGTGDLQKPVKIEPWSGMRMTAFKTGQTTPDGREVLFMPTAPNITTGFVIEVDAEKVTETGESVEEALTRVLSAGFGDREKSGVPIDVIEREESETGREDATDRSA